MQTALIVDDEQDIRDLLSFNLAKEGWQILEAEDGLTGLRMAKDRRPDVILLDLMLPGMDGLTVFRNLQDNNQTANIPVLMMTAQYKTQEDVIKGLSLGADDYVEKPFEVKELVLRVRNVVKRAAPNGGSKLKVGPFTLDRNSLKFYLKGEPVDLTATEFKLLLILIENPGNDQTRGELLRRIWGYDERIQTRTLDTHVKRLREKLGVYGECVETVRGVGYRFRPPTEQN